MDEESHIPRMIGFDDGFSAGDLDFYAGTHIEPFGADQRIDAVKADHIFSIIAKIDGNDLIAVCRIVDIPGKRDVLCRGLFFSLRSNNRINADEKQDQCKNISYNFFYICYILFLLFRIFCYSVK